VSISGGHHSNDLSDGPAAKAEANAKDRPDVVQFAIDLIKRFYDDDCIRH
jgi:hypothetical protein